jgi:hypothetical protein
MTTTNAGTPEPAPSSYPDIQRLFTHPLAEPGAVPEENYEGWEVDHLGKPRFFLSGVRQVCAKLKTFEMRSFYKKAAHANVALSQRLDWTSHIGTVLEEVAENQFNRVRNERPITFERAVFIMVTFEVMWDEAIKRGDLRGSRFDVYDQLKILPACYNLDGLTTGYLERLTRTHPNSLPALVAGCGHTDLSIVTDLAEGFCVARRTAVGIRKALEQLNGAEGIGAVRPRPGAKLGKKSTSDAEDVRPQDL